MRRNCLVIAYACLVFSMVITLLMTSKAFADATMEVSWNMSMEDQAYGDFFRVINQDNEVVADNVSADARSARFQTDGTAGAWRVDFVTVVDDVEYVSDTSKSAIWVPDPDPCPECPPCPEDPKPPTPSVYSITAEVTVQRVETDVVE